MTLTLEWDPSLIQIMLFFTLETNELLLSSFMGLSTYHNNFFDFYILFFLLLPGDSFKDVFTAASTKSPLCPSLTHTCPWGNGISRGCSTIFNLEGSSTKFSKISYIPQWTPLMVNRKHHILNLAGIVPNFSKIGSYQ